MTLKKYCLMLPLLTSCAFAFSALVDIETQQTSSAVVAVAESSEIQQLKTNLDRVAGHMQSIESPILIMAARGDSTDDRNGRFSQSKDADSYVFLDIDAFEDNPGPQHVQFKNRFIQMSFNDLTMLEILSQKLSNQFSQIYYDESVFKFTHWTAEHLENFKRMLKPGGNFHFYCDNGTGGTLFHNNHGSTEKARSAAKSEILDKIAQANQAKKIMINDYSIYFPGMTQVPNDIVLSDTDQPKVDQLLSEAQTYMTQFLSKNEKDENHFNVDDYYSGDSNVPNIFSYEEEMLIELATNQSILREKCEDIIKVEVFKSTDELGDVFNKMIIPGNIQPTLEGVFDQDNVHRYEGTLPFTANPAPKKQTFFKCSKP